MRRCHAVIQPTLSQSLRQDRAPGTLAYNAGSWRPALKRLLCVVLLVSSAFSQDSVPEKHRVLWQKLESTVDAVDRDLDGAMGVAVLDLTSGQKFLLHADDVFAQASSIKIAVLPSYTARRSREN